MVKFTAETKCSGVDMPDGTRIRKGASEAIRAIVRKAGNGFSHGGGEDRAHDLGERRYAARGLRKTNRSKV